MNTQQLHRKLTHGIFVAFKATQVYELENEALKRPLQATIQLLENVLKAESQLKFELVGRDLFINGNLVKSDLYTFSSFQFLANLFNQTQSGGFLLHEKPSFSDTHQFLKYLSEVASSKEAPANFKTLGPFELLPFEAKKSLSNVHQKQRLNDTQKALKSYVQAVDVLKVGSKTMTKGLSQRTILEAKRVVYNLVDLCQNEGFSFVGLSNIKDYDEYTFNHSINVCVISIAFGKNLGLTKKQVAELGMAALFHDFGKVEVPVEILNKPGKFTEDEWEVMRKHPVESVKHLIQDSDFQIQDLRKVIAAYEHHRSYDCTGYPNTGLGKPMNFFSKVVAIADAYDAMTTNRVYQRAMLATDALQILVKNAGTKFDPLLVKAFINTVGIFPVGSTVLLNNGHLAVVTESPKNPKLMLRPKLNIVSRADKTLLKQGKPFDLAEDKQEAYKIEKCVVPEDYKINVPFYLYGDAFTQSDALS